LSTSALDARREGAEGVIMVVKGDTNLLQIIRAGSSPSRLTRLLHGWQQKADKDANDGDDNEQFDQGKADMASGRANF
jgi:hypothetical protein